MVGNRYSFSAAIFYLGFIVGAYPAMVLAQRFPIERVASIIVALWGICLILTPACHNYQSLYAQRFFLGLLESGVSPMFMIIVVSLSTYSSHLVLKKHRVAGIRRMNRPCAWGRFHPNS